ncbi:MAG: Asp-tRNA(Asn)/Glu-tRNA(Gln) amidotransferase subunit GatC [Tissierellia bacterium]|nr:Asp-tRNA(Asn)/Glu-tRNA(Gln) amidotransferase subunit GatC [Tissierellia bacterium]
MERNEFDEMLQLAKLDVEDRDAFYEKWVNCMKVLSSIVEFEEDFEPLYTVHEAEVAPFEDIPEEGISTEDALKNAKEKKYGYFQVVKYV